MRYILSAIIGASLAVAAPGVQLNRRAEDLATGASASIPVPANLPVTTDQTFINAMNNFSPDPAEYAESDQTSWPYDSTVEKAVHEVKLTQVMDPEATNRGVTALSPEEFHLLWFGSSDQDPNGDGERDIAAGMILVTQPGKGVVDLGATDTISQIQCSKDVNGADIINVTFKTSKNAQDAMSQLTGAVTRYYMDAFGKYCGEEGTFQFWKQTAKAALSGQSVSIGVEVVQEKDILSEFRSAWGPDNTKAIEEASKQTVADGVTSKISKRSEEGKLTPEQQAMLDRYNSGNWPKSGPVCGAGLRMHRDHQKKKRGLLSGQKKWEESWTLDKKLNKDKTPWGQGLIFYKNNGITVACVDCGIKGKLTLSGAIEWNILKIASGGVTGAEAIMSVSGDATAKIGIDAQYNGEMKKGEVNKDLEQLAKELKARTDLPLTPLSLGKIFTIGASASLEPFIRAGLKSKGSIVVGVVSTLDNSVISVNLKNEQKFTTTGWKPKVQPVMELKADVTAEIVAGIRIGADFGLLVLSKKVGFSIIDEPSAYVQATLSLSESFKPKPKPTTKRDLQTIGERSDGTSLNTREVDLFKRADTCTGVNFKMGINNRVYAELNLWKPKVWPLIQNEVYKYDYCWKRDDILAWLKGDKPTCIADTDANCVNYKGIEDGASGKPAAGGSSGSGGSSVVDKAKNMVNKITNKVTGN